MNFRRVFLQILLQNLIDLFQLLRRFYFLAGEFVIKVYCFLRFSWIDFEFRQKRFLMPNLVGIYIISKMILGYGDISADMINPKSLY